MQQKRYSRFRRRNFAIVRPEPREPSRDAPSNSARDVSNGQYRAIAMGQIVAVQQIEGAGYRERSFCRFCGSAACPYNPALRHCDLF